MKIVERLRQFIDYKDISLDNFNKKISAGKGYIEKQIQRSGSIGGDKLEIIIKTFPELNPIWLLTGEGKMIKSDEKDAHTPIPNQIKESNNNTKKQIAPMPEGDFGRNFGRNLAGKGPKSAQNSSNPDVQFCYNCEAKDAIIEAKDILIDTLKSKEKIADMLIAEKDRTIQHLQRENARLSQHSGNRNKKAG